MGLLRVFHQGGSTLPPSLLDEEFSSFWDPGKREFADVTPCFSFLLISAHNVRRHYFFFSDRVFCLFSPRRWVFYSDLQCGGGWVLSSSALRRRLLDGSEPFAVLPVSVAAVDISLNPRPF